MTLKVHPDIAAIPVGGEITFHRNFREQIHEVVRGMRRLHRRYYRVRTEGPRVFVRRVA